MLLLVHASAFCILHSASLPPCRRREHQPTAAVGPTLHRDIGSITSHDAVITSHTGPSLLAGRFPTRRSALSYLSVLGCHACLCSSVCQSSCACRCELGADRLPVHQGKTHILEPIADCRAKLIVSSARRLHCRTRTHFGSGEAQVLGGQVTRARARVSRSKGPPTSTGATPQSWSCTLRAARRSRSQSPGQSWQAGKLELPRAAALDLCSWRP